MDGSTRCGIGRSSLVALSPLLCVLGGCSVTPPGEINELYQSVILDRERNYRIQPGDTLSITLYSSQQADLNQADVMVLPDGTCDLFFMDNFEVAGKTLSEIETAMREQVAKEVRDPEITIHVAPLPERVYLAGQFERSQFVVWEPGLTLGEAIAASNSWRITGLATYALLTRPYMNPRFPDRFRVSLWDQSEEILLLPGDQILLERNFWAVGVDWVAAHIFAILGPSPMSWLTLGAAL